MRFTVVWHDDASSELAELWLQSHNRSAVAKAADNIDFELAHNPAGKGHPVGDALLLRREPPLEVLFEVIEPDRIVRVLDVERVDE